MGEAEDKIKITLTIDKVRFPLHIRKEEEEFYRNAATLINDTLNKYRASYTGQSDEKYMAMALLDIALENQKLNVKSNMAPVKALLTELMEQVEPYIKK